MPNFDQLLGACHAGKQSKLPDRSLVELRPMRFHRGNSLF
jgi:hypothetical protein